MKRISKIFIVLFAAALSFLNAKAQDPTIQVLTQNGGTVAVGQTVFLQVTVGNAIATAVPANKIRVSISAPASVTLNSASTQLPAGYVICSNGGGTMIISNGTATITQASPQTILVAMVGTTTSGSQTITGSILFAGGTVPTRCSNGAPTGGNTLPNDAGTATVTVTPPAACGISVSAVAGSILCNGGTTTLTATASNANGTVEYSLNGGAYQSGNTFTVNAAGSPYTVTAREVATPSCTANSSAVTVNQPSPVVASGVVSAPIATFGGTGSITVSATGGTGPYLITVLGPNTYESDNNPSPTTLSGLLAGTYTVNVVDNNNCTATTTVVLNNPAACILSSVTIAAPAINCNGGTTTITATPVFASGSATVEYRLNNGSYQSGNVFSNVGAGTYAVTAREVGNTACTATSSSTTITAPSAVTATASVTTPIAVPGGTGSITVTGAGGTGAKTYVITSGTTTNTTGVNSGVFSGLLAGTYTFTATDANGCTGISAQVILANPGIATADPAVGQMFFTTTGGAVQSANNLLLAPASDVYDINIPFYNLNQLNPVPNGTIRFTINLGSKLVVAPGFTLANAPLNSYFTWSQTISGPNVIITGTQIAAIPADFDAIAKFRVKGDSACSSNIVSTIVITNEFQTLNDDDLQNNTASLRYILPVTLTKSQVNVTCNGAANGIINIVASSGTTVVTTGPGGYSNTRSLASGQNTVQLTSLLPGVYTITVSASSDTPLAGCSVTTTATIVQPTLLTIPSSGVSSTNNNCFGGTSGTITVSASGGTPPYVYTIAGPTVNTTGANSGVFTGLSAGSYTVTVTDNNGCTATTATIVITQPVGGITDISLGSDISGSLFANVGSTQTIVYNVAEISGNSAVGDTIRITKVAGFTINFNPTIFSTTVGGTTYSLDNPRWKIDDTNPAFVSIILTDQMNPSNPGTLLCNQLVNVAVTITRNTANKSTFTLSARLRKANGEVNLSNNLNSIILTAD